MVLGRQWQCVVESGKNFWMTPLGKNSCRIVCMAERKNLLPNSNLQAERGLLQHMHMPNHTNTIWWMILRALFCKDSSVYRAMLRRARCSMAKSSVCPSIRPSVTLRYRDHISSKSSKIIWPLVSLNCQVDLNVMDLFQAKQPEILAGIGEGYRKSGFRHTKVLISLKRGKIGPGCY